MRAVVAAVGTRGDVQPALAFCIERFRAQSLMSPDIAWNLQRDSDSLRLRTDGFGDWNFDQDGRTDV